MLVQNLKAWCAEQKYHQHSLAKLFMGRIATQRSMYQKNLSLSTKKTPIGKVSKTLSLLTTTLVVMEKTRKNLCLHIAMLP